jgi:hypothetical protein
MKVKHPDIPDISLKKQLTPVAVNKAEVSNYYTLLDPKNVFNTVIDFAEFYNATGYLPKELVSFRPKRLFMHEAALAYVTKARAKTFSEAERLKQMQEITIAILHALKEEPNYHYHIEHLLKEREEISTSLQQAFTDPAHKLAQFIARARSLVKTDKISQIGKFNKAETEKSLIIKIATNFCYNDYAYKYVQKASFGIVSKVLARLEVPELSLKPTNKRVNFMVSGGTASGKGYCLARLMKQAENMQLDWLDNARVNTDSFKSIIQFDSDGNTLLVPSQVSHLASQYLQDEAGILKSRVIERLKESIIQGEAPSVIIDQNAIDKSSIYLTSYGGGRCFTIFVLTPLDIAVRRSLERGRKDQRYESPVAMVQYHYDATKVSLETILSSELKGKDIVFEMIDNSVDQDLPKTMLTIDFKVLTVYIDARADLTKLYNKLTPKENGLMSAKIFTKRNALEQFTSAFAKLGYKIAVEKLNYTSSYTENLLENRQNKASLRSML